MKVIGHLQVAQPVERAGMTTLNGGQRLSFDVVNDPRKGKTNAQNLKAV
jgi:CspA family cold shock protein